MGIRWFYIFGVVEDLRMLAPEGTRLRCRPGRGGNKGVMPVQPGMSDSPPDCRI